MLGERVPEGGGSDREGSVPPGSVLGFGERGEEVGVGGAEVAGGVVWLQKVGEVGGS